MRLYTSGFAYASRREAFTAVVSLITAIGAALWASLAESTDYDPVLLIAGGTAALVFADVAERLGDRRDRTLENEPDPPGTPAALRAALFMVSPTGLLYAFAVVFGSTKARTDRIEPRRRSLPWPSVAIGCVVGAAVVMTFSPRFRVAVAVLVIVAAWIGLTRRNRRQD